MEKNIIYNQVNNNIMPIDTSQKDFAMKSLQQRKEKLEKMKQEALDARERRDQIHQQMKQEALDARERRDQIHQQMKQEDMLRYSINEYGENIRPGKSR